MSYTPSTTWAPGVAGGTLIRAVNLNHIESGISQNADDISGLRTDLNTTNSNVTDLSGQVAQLRDDINKGNTGSSGGTGSGIASVNGYTGPNVILDKSDVLLGNVNNTSDANKPISTATQSALDTKAPLNSPAFTGNVTGINKASVALGNVDNTSDMSKPVSTAVQNALAAKASLASPTFTGTVNGITKAMVGLGNVDNTSDVTKFNTWGKLPTLYYTGTTWPARNLPTGYNGSVIWNSETYDGAASPPGAIDNDRWERKRPSA